MSGRIPIKIFEYNRDGKHIRTFQNMSLCRNLNVLVKLTNIPQGTISQQLSRGLQSVPRGEFIFKYKEEEIEL